MDTLDEHSVRTLLHEAARTPEPPSAVDVDAARRRGGRQLRARRAALPVLAVVALAAALTVPGGLLSRHSERTVASPAVDAPWQFNPLVPYASFGWLPPGYSENNADYRRQPGGHLGHRLREPRSRRARGRATALLAGGGPGHVRGQHRHGPAGDYPRPRAGSGRLHRRRVHGDRHRPEHQRTAGVLDGSRLWQSPGSTRRMRGPSFPFPESPPAAARPCRRRRRRGRCC